MLWWRSIKVWYLGLDARPPLVRAVVEAPLLAEAHDEGVVLLAVVRGLVEKLGQLGRLDELIGRALGMTDGRTDG